MQATIRVLHIVVVALSRTDLPRWSSDTAEASHLRTISVSCTHDLCQDPMSTCPPDKVIDVTPDVSGVGG